METCVYRDIGFDGHYHKWETACGRKLEIIAPDEVGMSFAPLPNAHGKFCRYCGKEIELKMRK